MKPRLSIAVVLFQDFELLDVFGPLEMFGLLHENFELCLAAESGDIVASRQGPRSVVDQVFTDDRQYDILLVPGGNGTRRQVDNPILLDWLRQQSAGAQYVTSVCTGSALLATKIRATRVAASSVLGASMKSILALHIASSSFQFSRDS